MNLWELRAIEAMPAYICILRLEQATENFKRDECERNASELEQASFMFILKRTMKRAGGPEKFLERFKDSEAADWLYSKHSRTEN